MSDQTTSNDKSKSGGLSARPWWQWVLGIGLLLLAGINYYWSGRQVKPVEQKYTHVPKPIEIPAGFKAADRIPAEAGELAGCNVLLVTMDTTRADRLGCYGNGDIETPTLDRLAGEGVIFSQATATAPTTLPTHASILTGLYPLHHGARANGLYRLDDAHETLTEVLAESGYATGAVISAFVLDSCFGLAQGFEHYDDDLSGGGATGPWRYQERRANHTTEQAVRWLRGAADQRFFLWVHYFDPHVDYEPPSPYAEQYKENPYDGEIAFVDAELGGLLDVLDELELTNQTLVVVVGDHGESLGQHNETTHGYLAYEATLRVPLIMRCGQRLGGGAHIRRRVSQVDLMPTILSLLGVTDPGGTDGVDLVKQEPQARPIFAETVHGLVACGWAALLVAYDGPHKYIHGPIPELFNLSRDFQEERNLHESEGERVAALKQKLVEFFGPDLDLAQIASPTVTLSASDLGKLRGLGYLGTAADLAAPAARPDPKEMMSVMHRVERAAAVDVTTGVGKGIEKLEQITQEYPTFLPAFRFLGELCRMAGRLDEAVEAYERAIEISTDASALHGLAQARLQQGEKAAAEEVFRELISKYPDHLQARQLLGMLMAESQRYGEAIEQLKYIFDADPDFAAAGAPPVAGLLVQVYGAADRLAELPGVLLPRLEADPQSAGTRAALAAYYVSQGQFAEAEAVLREGVALMPHHRHSVCNLARYLVTCPNLEARKPYEGVALVERLCREAGYVDTTLLAVLSELYGHSGRGAEGVACAEKLKAMATEANDYPLLVVADHLLTRLREVQERGRVPAAPTSKPSD